MSQPNEHDDDLESEVTEGAAVETDQYEEADGEEITSAADVIDARERPPAGNDQADVEEPDDEAADTM
jgi:hypothetical protein